jgi:hypothetical protein
VCFGLLLRVTVMNIRMGLRKVAQLAVIGVALLGYGGVANGQPTLSKVYHENSWNQSITVYVVGKNIQKALVYFAGEQFDLMGNYIGCVKPLSLSVDMTFVPAKDVSKGVKAGLNIRNVLVAGNYSEAYSKPAVWKATLNRVFNRVGRVKYNVVAQDYQGRRIESGWSGEGLGGCTYNVSNERVFTLPMLPLPTEPVFITLPRQPKSLTLSCPSSVNENSSSGGVCTATVYYTDNSSRAVTPSSWSSTSTTLSVRTNGALSTANVNADTRVTVTGTYSENNGRMVQGTAMVTVRDIPSTPTIRVTSVSPSTVTLNRSTTFTIRGSGLPSQLAVWIGECVGNTSPTLYSSGSSTTHTFTCTPRYSKGTKDGVVKDRANGITLLNFRVNVR